MAFRALKLMANKQNALLFAGSSNSGLAQEVSQNLAIPLGKIEYQHFPDKEISLQIQETVRGRDAYVIQSTALDPNNYLMELLIIIDALKRASAQSICAVLPYFGYSRQDRKDKPRVPITAKLVANLLEKAGASRILTMDLHAEQLQGFFDIPVDNLYARQPLADAFKTVGSRDIVVVTPDFGSIKLARAYAGYLGCDLAIIDKNRVSASNVKVVNLIGDVEGKDVLLADDMCSTAGTLVSAANACREKGANRIFAAVTHGLFVEDAVAMIEESPIEVLWVSNTISNADRLAGSKKIRTVSVAHLFGQAIRCIIERRSISSLFEDSDVSKR